LALSASGSRRLLRLLRVRFCVVVSACLMCLSMVSYFGPFLFLFFTVDSLTTANARIASLEAELDTSRKA
jgi:hypothetical protein